MRGRHNMAQVKRTAARLSALACALFLLASAPGLSQQTEGVLVELNQKLNTIIDGMSKAQSLQVHYLSPNEFSKASEYLADARADLAKGKDVKSIKENLEKAETHLAQALKNTKEAKKQLPELIKARDDALAAEAPTYALEQFEEADNHFRKAMAEIENNDLNDAIKEGKKGEEKFRQAELTAIKASIIGQVHDLLEQARDEKAEKFAPITLERAESLITEAENILNTNRNAQSTARELAEEAEYEAKHAIFLSAFIQENRKEESSWEKDLIGIESELITLAQVFNLRPHFDSGYQEPINNLTRAAGAMQDDKKELAQNLNEMQKEIRQLEQEMDQMASELDVTRQQEAGLKAKLAAEKRREEKLKRIRSQTVSSG